MHVDFAFWPVYTSGHGHDEVEHLQLEIDALADDEFAQLHRWIADRDWERWDEQLEPVMNYWSPK